MCRSRRTALNYERKDQNVRKQNSGRRNNNRRPGVHGSVNEALHKFNRLIVGRLGIPYRERGVHVISVVLDGTSDDISALTGRLGKIEHVTVKAAMSKR